MIKKISHFVITNKDVQSPRRKTIMSMRYKGIAIIQVFNEKYNDLNAFF